MLTFRLRGHGLISQAKGKAQCNWHVLKGLSALISFIIVFLMSSAIYGTTLYARASGSWSSGSTWSTSRCGGTSCGCTPTNGDVVIICSGYTITASANLTIGPGGDAANVTIDTGAYLSLGSYSLQVKNGGTLTILDTLSTGGITFNNSGVVTVGAGRIIKVNGNFTNRNNSSSIVVNGLVIITGDYTGGNGSTITGTGEVIVEGTSSGAGTIFGLALGCSNCTFPHNLPITLAYFTAHTYNSAVTLMWETLSEYNNKEFIILRSTDGNICSPIATIKGGNSTTEHTYTLIDTFPKEGINYYILKQTDYDGHYTFSKIVTVTNVMHNPLFIYPNPASTFFRIKYAGTSVGVLSIKITDLTGRIIMSHNYTLHEGIDVYKVDIQSLITGCYLLEVFDGVDTKVIRFNKI